MRNGYIVDTMNFTVMFLNVLSAEDTFLQTQKKMFIGNTHTAIVVQKWKV